MAETLFLPQAGSKEEIYPALLPQVEALISGEPNLVANLANLRIQRAADVRDLCGVPFATFLLRTEERVDQER